MAFVVRGMGSQGILPAQALIMMINMAGPIGKEEEEEASTRIGENSMARSQRILKMKEPSREEMTKQLVDKLTSMKSEVHT